VRLREGSRNFGASGPYLLKGVMPRGSEAKDRFVCEQRGAERFNRADAPSTMSKTRRRFEARCAAARATRANPWSINVD
jgi:hypothetical protein